MRIIEEDNLIDVGYWNNKQNDFPEFQHPKDLINTEFWKGKDISSIKKYLDEKPKAREWMGYSRCRICGKILGAICRSDGTYRWPDQLSHYIDHDVKLPQEFIDHINKNK